MTDNIERSKTVDLIEPIKAGGHEYSSLTFRPGKVGERRMAEGHLRSGNTPENLTKFAIQMLCKSANVPDAVIEQMYNDQFVEVWDWFASFVAASPREA